LTVADGGVVTVNGGLFASLNDLHGNGIISASGALLMLIAFLTPPTGCSKRLHLDQEEV